MYHCFFEQSGTFKNEFLKLGYDAKDYDIKNDFGQTDCVIDLFAEIEKAYNNQQSVFDIIAGGGDKIQLLHFIRVRDLKIKYIWHFNGTQWQLQNKSELYKLENNLKLHSELHYLYQLVTKLAIVCIKKNIPLIIENPYSTEHYLTRYWCLKPKVIDKDRTQRGDHFKKPTQYYFINREPSQNMIFEPLTYKDKQRVERTGSEVQRSMIASEYANRFIREFIL